MDDKPDKMLAQILAQLGAEIAIMNSREPLEMARVAALLNDANAYKVIGDLILAIMPEQVDGPQWIGWIQGGSPPLPRPLTNPDAGPRPHAHGAMQGAQARHDAAANRVAALDAKLAQAREELALAAGDLHRATEQVRIVVLYRLMIEIGRQASALSIGPVYTVLRAISPYFQHDPAFEAGLEADRRDLLEERRGTREADSREILDRLDRYAGDPQLELMLHRAILKVVRDVHDRHGKENADARANGKPMPATNKQRAIRRSFKDQQRGLHPAAPIIDAPDVFDAFPGRHGKDVGDSEGEGEDAGA
jgi:hypothetical protein